MRGRLVQLLFLSIFLVMAVGPGAWAQDQRVLVPDFALLTAADETVRLSDFRGQVVALNFWATWCFYCREEMPDLQALHEELAASGEAVILLLDQIDGRQETVERGTAYLAENGITIPNLLDFGSVGQRIFGVPGLPTTVVIDAEGYLYDYVVGSTTKEVLREMIEGAK
ncbi:MAG TPA: TlpA family protein disulfide reductase [Firmicutes bacterium]|jgi:thiol-disulfide isomerase/thioredoxin|nr:TlpA disulfide reductase family protein [Bacillota bacterium]HHT43709.1 TlpA family protein disulfide reductase [Bacillota bacterium]